MWASNVWNLKSLWRYLTSEMIPGCESIPIAWQYAAVNDWEGAFSFCKSTWETVGRESTECLPGGGRSLLCLWETAGVWAFACAKRAFWTDYLSQGSTLHWKLATPWAQGRSISKIHHFQPFSSYSFFSCSFSSSFFLLIPFFLLNYSCFLFLLLLRFFVGLVWLYQNLLLNTKISSC